MKKLPGDYIAGFVDGEGCFSLKFRIDKKINKSNSTVRTYFYWGLEFAVVLREDDTEILQKIQNSMGCGKINVQRSNQVRFSVQGISEISKIVIPFFIKYPLRAKKAHDFKLWSQAAEIIRKYRDGKLNTLQGQRGFTKKDISSEDSTRLIQIREEMLNYKSSRSTDFKWRGYR